MPLPFLFKRLYYGAQDTASESNPSVTESTKSESRSSLTTKESSPSAPEDAESTSARHPHHNEAEENIRRLLQNSFEQLAKTLEKNPQFSSLSGIDSSIQHLVEAQLPHGQGVDDLESTSTNANEASSVDTDTEFFRSQARRLRQKFQ
eukprot:CAMPEP_0185851348 /NCGR_PEP_ID=MMETSP1354-20130828/8999_1 /TAXON_ID=708628 /ORGANISM="Erythrolobus madagascarensis, Strain CCMP3276" /LENGTH=147 /DNA_ID=CAMNT_0028552317 /DNA_START=235 /DNA_END=678 /DNA_ORIENTATION=+